MNLEILGNGWNISQIGREIITSNQTISNKSQILKNALNADLKEIGLPILSKILNNRTITDVVLQIQKVRNISAPKANEKSQAAPRMLKLILTDGDTFVQGIEFNPLPTINYDKTPPGSKLFIKSAKVSMGYILLDSNNCSLLGGEVPTLYEKWQLAKSVQHQNRQSNSNDGPPAWVNFGSKIQSDPQDKHFRSLEEKNEAKENTKFDQARQDAIAEATSGAVKKVFGGGSKQAVQQPVKPFRKPIERRTQKGKNMPVQELDEKPQKPSDRVSLFDFLENKLPVEPEPTKHYQNRSTNYNNQNNSANYNSKNNQFNHMKKSSYNSNFHSGDKDSSVMHNKLENSLDNKQNHQMNVLNNSFNKMTVNPQFATKTFKQHLNLPPQKKNDNSGTLNNQIEWKLGDECMAKYWEDKKFYTAIITAVTEKTCVVKFKGYGNIEEVLKTDCLPKSSLEANKKSLVEPNEFRRNSRTFRRQ